MALEGQLYPIGYLPTATYAQLGVVQIGTGLIVDSNGPISVIPGAVARETRTLTTASINVNANLQTSLVISKAFHCLQITTDVPARIRIYKNTTYQAADVGRAIITDFQNYLNFAATDNGLALEVVTNLSQLTVQLNPVLISADPSNTTIPITISNLSGSNATVQVDLVVLPVE